VDYAGSPLVADHETRADAIAGPRPGQRYPDRTRFGGTSHHVLVFGGERNAAALERLGRRWSALVRIAADAGVDPARAGVPSGGVIAVRPDGHIAFRHPSARLDGLVALDRHLASYLIPDPVAAPLDEATPRRNG
jgi:hypothetical protein